MSDSFFDARRYEKFESTLEAEIRENIRDVIDYPKPGIVFKDITPLLAKPKLVQAIVAEQAAYWKKVGIEAVVGIEARGFIFGALLAQTLQCPFIPVRKSGKLPYKYISESYALEYGEASIDMHEDAVAPGSKVLIHDDLLATGGTAMAAAQLVERLGGEVGGFSFLINLSFLEGEKKISEKYTFFAVYQISY